MNTGSHEPGTPDANIERGVGGARGLPVRPKQGLLAPTGTTILTPVSQPSCEEFSPGNRLEAVRIPGS